jgi:hypothetical protein
VSGAMCLSAGGRLSRLLGAHFSAVDKLDGRAAEWTVNDVLVGSLFVIGIILATYEQAVTEGLPVARSDGGVGSWFETTF